MLRSPRTPLALLALLASFAAAAQTGGSRLDALFERMTREEAEQTAQLFGHCGGVYAAFSVFTAQQAPERSREYKAMGNGALTAGAYLLYREYRARERRTRPVAEFMPPLRAEAEKSASGLLAAFADEDFDTAQEELASCFKMAEMQDFLVAAMKDEVGRH